MRSLFKFVQKRNLPMLKLITLILFITMSFVLPAQHTRVYTICASPDSAVKVIFVQEGSDMQRYITFEKKGKQDTLFLDYSNEFNSNNCTLTQLQIDGEGLMEIHLEWTYNDTNGIGDYIGNESSWGKREHFVNHEIWNLDTKERLFEVLSDYYHHSFQSHKGKESSTTTQRSLDFEIDEHGTITLSNMVFDSYSFPENEEGVYRFVGGAYVRE